MKGKVAILLSLIILVAGCLGGQSTTPQEKLENLDQIKTIFNLSKSQIDYLTNNGILVIPNGRGAGDIYSLLVKDEVPGIITVDSAFLLYSQVYLISYFWILENDVSPTLRNLLLYLVRESAKAGDIDVASYLAVALLMLDPNVTLPAPLPVSKPNETGILSAITWLTKEGINVSSKEGNLEVVRLAKIIKGCPECLQNISRIDSELTFFLGPSRGLSVLDYVNNLDAIASGRVSPLQLLASKQPLIVRGRSLEKELRVSLFGVRLDPGSYILETLIYPNLGPNPTSKTYSRILAYGDSAGLLSKPISFYRTCDNLDQNRDKYWGEIYEITISLYKRKIISAKDANNIIPLLPNLVYLPAVLGSSYAYTIASSLGYCDFQFQYKRLVNQFREIPPDSMKNRAARAIKLLFEAGRPRSDGWEKRFINTTISFWLIMNGAENFTIVKDTIPSGRLADAYIEPYPEVYAELYASLKELDGFLTAMGVNDETLRWAVNRAAALMLRAYQVSTKIKEGKTLTEDDLIFLTQEFPRDSIAIPHSFGGIRLPKNLVIYSREGMSLRAEVELGTVLVVYNNKIFVGPIIINKAWIEG
ncbi:hypothetical protein A3L04_05065 [Thermococcus chitonophagus]|uniref:Uncharacterized protein n=1 Tax=Thermococcus chitonophagus TaxID=54262 RepID=A0A160VTJ9_9EURY|nr:DUF3160 domain-containing protein [Thermococcus chitonophagus]ASJ16488.1 hypothetical protein A3L04_05065 [Thermococcus chitonophagus]CUX78513.1 hypothetical protein CHITON_1734 [Thermococcus chitonophagus]